MIGSFDKKTVVHIFSMDEQALKAHIHEDARRSVDGGVGHEIKHW